ncbi:hypothetical protein GXP67_26355 [Rhodocytophaga rosea]|uniref:Uncharacterized protein n=1 Tax=Rhodocytophaga rosea TaxID=2704465 RepID=A0A6C0GPD3_9BACT|nr:hypothetical protein [Rhodocytophaga rosea]QHT69915.1 hypothetical protein GXP67_26355 [Rhodocytophaga rosea]
MLKRLHLLGMLVLFLVLNCCQREKTEPVVYRVPADVEKYVQRFLEEASLRNRPMEITNLIMEFAEIDSTIIQEDAQVCAACRQTKDHPERQKTITINTKINCWQFLTDQAREALVFHELGHCVLQRRGHKDSLLPNGDYASLMNSKVSNMYESCVYDIGGGPCNKLFKRQYYLDELFNENTPVPDWAK